MAQITYATEYLTEGMMTLMHSPWSEEVADAILLSIYYYLSLVTIQVLISLR
jgi:hypothetical protein